MSNRNQRAYERRRYPDDWQKYYSRSEACWCWESRSRRVSYPTASRSQAVFEAGWVILPRRHRDDADEFFNIFTEKSVYSRREMEYNISKEMEYNISKDNDNSNNNNNNSSSNNININNNHHIAQNLDNNKKRPREQQQADQLEAAAHYDREAADSRNKRSRQDRNKGSVAKMRAFNNWVKAVLMDAPLKALDRRQKVVRVLELACGKGGDYFKMQTACVSPCLEYVGVDIAKVGLEEFVKRLGENRKNRKSRCSTSQKLAVVNLGTDSLTQDPVPLWENGKWKEGTVISSNQPPFDLVSMQFSVHYMFENSDRLTNFFASWADYLREGCYFSVTTMDAEIIRRHLKDVDPSETDIVLKDEQGRPTCTMTFDKATKEALLKPDWSRHALGMRYRFTLTEYNDKGEAYNLVEAPEWIVSLDVLCDYAERNGNLSLVRQESMNFHEFYRSHERPYRQLFQRMRVLPREGQEFSDLEWKLVGLYRTCVFRKEGRRRY